MLICSMSRITMKKIIIVAIFTLFSWPYMTSVAEIELPEIGDSAGSVGLAIPRIPHRTIFLLAASTIGRFD